MNLLEETKEKLEENGKTFNDVVWVGNKDVYLLTEQYIKMFNIEYDEDFGSQQICSDLMVVGEDWWLERHEYDGSEWWEFKTIPQMPRIKYKGYNVLPSGYQTLTELHEEALKDD